jgi:hypothetical protein
VLYDLQGRRIQGSPKHGVYIQNGKKVMKNWMTKKQRNPCFSQKYFVTLP